MECEIGSGDCHVDTITSVGVVRFLEMFLPIVEFDAYGELRHGLVVADRNLESVNVGQENKNR
eukprot:2649395-Amphidinium_carterae.1